VGERLSRDADHGLDSPCATAQRHAVGFEPEHNARPSRRRVRHGAQPFRCFRAAKSGKKRQIFPEERPRDRPRDDYYVASAQRLRKHVAGIDKRARRNFLSPVFKSKRRDPAFMPKRLFTRDAKQRRERRAGARPEQYVRGLRRRRSGRPRQPRKSVDRARQHESGYEERAGVFPEAPFAFHVKRDHAHRDSGRQFNELGTGEIRPESRGRVNPARRRRNEEPSQPRLRSGQQRG